MKIRHALALIASHGVVAVAGFAAGIYALPILIAPTAPSHSEVTAVESGAIFNGEFRRELPGSDALHWGEGVLSVGADTIAFMGELAPGPDYKLYLSPEYVETEDEFLLWKDRMTVVGDVKTFQNFIVPVSPAIDPSNYTTAIVWCESFGEFITAAQYR